MIPFDEDLRLSLSPIALFWADRVAIARVHLNPNQVPIDLTHHHHLECQAADRPERQIA